MAASPSKEDIEDQRRMQPRAYPLGRIARVVIGGARFRDAQGAICSSEAVKPITQRQVRAYLSRAVPVSQISVMNYYGVHGECVSDDVDVYFSDGRHIRMAFAAESGVAYLSPVVRGRESDVFFYYCEDCKP